MTIKKKSRIRIITGLVLCILLLVATAGLAVTDKKIKDNLQKVSNSIENNTELTVAEETYNNLKTEVNELRQQVESEEKE